MNTKNRYIINTYQYHITATFPFNISLDNLTPINHRRPFCSLPDGAKASRDGTAMLRKILHDSRPHGQNSTRMSWQMGMNFQPPRSVYVCFWWSFWGTNFTHTRLEDSGSDRINIYSIFGWLGCSNSEFWGALVGLSAVISTISSNSPGWSLPSFPPEIGKIT